MKTLISTKWNLLSLCGVIFVIFIFASSDANAIPAFSRKYKTSCATCHVAFPKLTAFGEAFRRNGYQFPDGTDLENTKENPVSLGSNGNKKAFPNAIWPSTIPGTSPIAVYLVMETTYTPHEDQKWNFGSIDNEMGLLAAGTLGDDISFFSQLTIAPDEIGIERVSIIFDNIFGGTTATANLRIGKFAPGVYSFSNHRKIGADYSINTITLGDNQWALEGTQRGMELNGVVGMGRLGYNVGLVEGSGNLANSDKDYYVHLNYKFGGMRLDGVVPENSVATGPTQPWEDNSVTIGGFVYRGAASLTDDLKDKFTMFGGDVNISYDRLNLIGAFARHNDDNPYIDMPHLKGVMNSYMVEATYIIYPWLIPLARFESSKTDRDQLSQNIISPAIEILVRANVRISLEFNWVSQPSDSDPTQSIYAFDEFAGSVHLGF